MNRTEQLLSDVHGIPVSDVQKNVVNLFAQYGPMDDYQLIHRYRKQFGFVSESTPRTRRRELADAGIVRRFPVTHIGRAKRDLSVWGLA